MAAISKQEYLKRYLSNPDDEKRNLKKRKKVKTAAKFTKSVIVDDDVGLDALRPSKEAQSNYEEELQAVDEAPVVFDADGVTAISAESYKKREEEKKTKWAPVNALQGPALEFQSRIDGDVDSSPPRRRQLDSPDLSPRRHGYRAQTPDTSPVRRIRHDSPDNSPPRRSRPNKNVEKYEKRNQRVRTPDNSPPRQNRNVSPDSSPPRKLRHDSPDNSPPRRKQIRTKRHDSPDLSPVRHLQHDSPDISPARRRQRSHDLSPPRTRRHDSSDESPPRRRRMDSPDISPPRQRVRQDSDESPPRRRRLSPGSASDRRRDREIRGKSELKVSSVGKKAGLHSATQLKTENELAKKREEVLFAKMDASVSGRDAETVHRDKHGKKRDLKFEKLKQREKERKKMEEDVKFMEWGKGVTQTKEAKDKWEDELYEMSKPLARYKDDKDLDDMLKGQDRAGDPMLAFIQKKQVQRDKKAGVKAKPRYSGRAPPPNRFTIWPGYRWDGVDRSNGFEKKRFEMISSKRATREEAYKWSTEDM